jgi:long-chain acyl-CoA synthetase
MIANTQDLPRLLDSAQSLPEAFFAIAERDPERIVYTQAYLSDDDQASTPRPTLSRSFREVKSRVLSIAHYLRSLGLQKGSKVAIISNSRPEWCECDMAVLSLGGVVVSVYPSLPHAEIGYILFDSEADVIFAENQEQVDKLLELLKGPIRIPATEDREELTTQLGIRHIIAFEAVERHPLIEQLSNVLGSTERAAIEDYRSLKREDLAALVYTSGTTGPPKGVMQTHGNHLANVRQAWVRIFNTPDTSIMVFLPLAHAFARLMGFIGFLTPVKLMFPAIQSSKSSKLDPASMTRDIREIRAAIFPIVPRLLEKMQSGISEKAAKSKVLKYTLELSKRVYDSKCQGSAVSIFDSLMFLLTGPVRKKIKVALFGTNFDFCVSGGAKLNPTTNRFFDMLGIEVLEGYGLTETVVATNINLKGKKKIGSVGPILAEDIELKLESDGEICYRGPNIAPGYYKRPTATKNSWTSDGWFHTGDLGALDEDGYLSIVGRKKEILVSSYGKNIAPDRIEGIIKSSPYVAQAVLIGDGRPYTVVLIVPDKELLQEWARKRGLGGEFKQIIADESVEKLLWTEIEKLGSEIANYEYPKKMLVVAEDFTLENGLLTPTFKVKRSLVEKFYADRLSKLYEDQ